MRYEVPEKNYNYKIVTHTYRHDMSSYNLVERTEIYINDSTPYKVKLKEVMNRYVNSNKEELFFIGFVVNIHDQIFYTSNLYMPERFKKSLSYVLWTVTVTKQSQCSHYFVITRNIASEEFIVQYIRENKLSLDFKKILNPDLIYKTDINVERNNIILLDECSIRCNVYKVLDKYGKEQYYAGYSDSLCDLLTRLPSDINGAMIMGDADFLDNGGDEIVFIPVKEV